MEHFSRSVPIGRSTCVRRALKLAVGLAIAQRSSTSRLMYGSHDTEISGPANGGGGEGFVWDDGASRPPLSRPSHYRIRSSSKCESLVWKFLVGSLQEICRDTSSLARQRRRDVSQRARVIYLTGEYVFWWVEFGRDRKSGWRVSHVTILYTHRDWMFLKFFRLLMLRASRFYLPLRDF